MNDPCRLQRTLACVFDARTAVRVCVCDCNQIVHTDASGRRNPRGTAMHAGISESRLQRCAARSRMESRGKSSTSTSLREPSHRAPSVPSMLAWVAMPKSHVPLQRNPGSLIQHRFIQIGNTTKETRVWTDLYR